ncbi:MAG: hypothetical protein IJY04_00840 [Clostridia bacterium]|nr:hypothetical protein [Clostridia bacterium]
MQETIERLWNDYLSEKCATINSEEEHEFTRKAIAMHEKASALLTSEQEAAVQAYIDALCNLDAILTKKAFIKGCEFTLSFFLEARGLKK